MAADAGKLKEAKTVEGSTFPIRVEQGSVFVGERSKVTKADIKASNGVIHAVDYVILPLNLNL